MNIIFAFLTIHHLHYLEVFDEVNEVVSFKFNAVKNLDDYTYMYFQNIITIVDKCYTELNNQEKPKTNNVQPKAKPINTSSKSLRNIQGSCIV